MNDMYGTKISKVINADGSFTVIVARAGRLIAKASGASVAEAWVALAPIMADKEF